VNELCELFRNGHTVIKMDEFWHGRPHEQVALNSIHHAHNFREDDWWNSGRNV